MDVGVILPNYNYARWLTETVQSIAASDRPPRVVVFVDDASTDDSIERWEKARHLLTDKGIKTHQVYRDTNGGTSAALNSGIRECRTEWILPLATDDKLMSHALDELESCAYAGGRLMFDHVAFGYHAFGGSKYTRIYREARNLAIAYQNNQRLSSGCSPFRRVFWEMTPFDERMRGCEDTAFWIRAGNHGMRSTATRRPCVWVRRHKYSSLHYNVRPHRHKIRKHLKTILDSPMSVDFMANERHFIDHLFPIWDLMPYPFQGRFIVPERLGRYAASLGARATIFSGDRRNIKPILDTGGRPRLVVTCSSGDQRAVANAGHYSVFAEHGAGQTYSSLHESYAGYPGRRDVVAFLCPGEHPARRNKAHYRSVPVYQIGCPKMDKWQSGDLEPPTKQTVAISFHWDCNVTPETRSTFGHYKHVLGPLASRFDLIGHCHPRMVKTAKPEFDKHGIEFVPNFEDVLARASLYVIDNSSTMFEFAAAAPPGRSRPVVVLNAPWYRRNTRHGMRFWEFAQIGVNVDDPTDLIGAIESALSNDTEEQRAIREHILSKVYAIRDGKSAVAACNAILSNIRRVPVRHTRRNGKVPPRQRYDMTTTNVKMQALATFRNRKHEGRVKIGDVFVTTELRAVQLERQKLAVRFLDPIPVLDPSRPLPGPSVLKDEPEVVRVDEPDVISGVDEDENDVSGKDDEQGMYKFVSTDKRGQYDIVDPDGGVVQRIRGKSKAAERCDELNA